MAQKAGRDLPKGALTKVIQYSVRLEEARELCKTLPEDIKKEIEGLIGPEPIEEGEAREKWLDQVYDIFFTGLKADLSAYVSSKANQFRDKNSLERLHYTMRKVVRGVAGREVVKTPARTTCARIIWLSLPPRPATATHLSSTRMELKALNSASALPAPCWQRATARQRGSLFTAFILPPGPQR
jgi:hypothetical protein